MLEIDGLGPLRATLVDAANPAVFVAASDLGLSGAESPDAMEGDAALMALLDRVRRAAGVAMGLGATPEAVGLASPRMAAVAGPLAARTLDGRVLDPDGHDVTVRMLSMGRPHRAVPMTGAMALAVACRVEGSVPHAMAARRGGGRPEEIRVAHPSGTLTVGAEVRRASRRRRLERGKRGRVPHRAPADAGRGRRQHLRAEEEDGVPDPARRFRVGYLSYVPHQSFLDTAAAQPSLEVVRIPLEQPEEAVIAALAECDAYYCMASRDELPRPFHVHAALLSRLPKLLMVGSTGAGYDPIDPVACTAAGVVAVNQAGGNAEGVAEHAVGMMLALLKRMPEAQAAMRAGRAQDRAALMGRELRGRTVGLVGIGHVGTRTAEILRLAFSCRVLACDPYLDAATVAARGATKVEMPELLAESDVVSLHLPLTPESRGMMGADAFARMRPGAIFVTTARGSIHDEPALHAALASGHIAGAGLDVWEQEPPPAGPPAARLAERDPQPAHRRRHA